MKRKIILSIALFNVLPFLYGCKKKGEEKTPEIPVVPQAESIANMLEEGKPYTVVVPNDASECINFAASQIAYYFQQVSGKDIEIKKDVDVEANLNTNSRFISLWKTTLYNKAENIHGNIDLSKNALNSDGFYIFTYGDNVFINSNIERGTLYGAYQLIEDSFGVRFLTDDYTYVPKINDNIPVYKYDRAYVPNFEQRCYLNSSVWNCESDYVSHLRFNTDFAQLSEKYGGYTKWCDYGAGPSGTTHSLQIILPATNDEFCEENLFDDQSPDFKRIKPEYHEVWSHVDNSLTSNPRVDAEGNCDLCFTNGIEYSFNSSTGKPNSNSTVYLVFEYLKKYIISNPDCDNFMLGQADTPTGCGCSHCLSSLAKYNHKRSALTIIFANKLSTMVDEWIKAENIKGVDGNKRKVNFSIFAYTYNEEPPLDNNGNLVSPLCKPLPNVFVKYAPIWSIYYFGLDDSRNTSNTYGVCEKWSKVADTMLSWTYHTFFSDYFWYLDTTHGMKGTLQTLKKCGVIYAMGQGIYTEKAPYQQYLEAYVYSKLCWDFNLNVNDLVDEFILYYFGADAFEYIKKFHTNLTLKYEEIALESPTILRNITEVSSFTNWPINTVNDFVNCFDVALEKTLANDKLSYETKNAYANNIRRGSLMPLFMRLKNSRLYSSFSKSDVTELAIEFTTLASYFGVQRMGEASDLTLGALKKDFGI